jgi:GNAT superfamily N-acetyltransferase
MTSIRPVKPRTVEVRRLHSDDWRLYRTIRVRALLDAPEAFGSTAAEAKRLGEEEWRRRLSTRAAFVALDGTAPVGLVSGIEAEEAGDAELISMWVDPRWRRQGVASLLIDTVIDWATGQGFSGLRLWVADGNENAERLYARAGFKKTGQRQLMGHGPGRMEFAMLRPL